MAVQWLGFCAPATRGLGLIPGIVGEGAKIQQVTGLGLKKKKKNKEVA